MVKSEYLVCGYLGNFSNELGFFRQVAIYSAENAAKTVTG